jgi:hypothetical protein
MTTNTLEKSAQIRHTCVEGVRGIRDSFETLRQQELENFWKDGVKKNLDGVK